MRNTHTCGHPFSELLIAADSGSLTLHQLHLKEHSIDVGRGICTFGYCVRLFEVVRKAQQNDCPRCREQWSDTEKEAKP